SENQHGVGNGCGRVLQSDSKAQGLCSARQVQTLHCKVTVATADPVLRRQGQDKVYLCNSPGCPGTRFVDQAGLELTEIYLSLPPKCWDKRYVCVSDLGIRGISSLNRKNSKGVYLQER
ncbi:hypothetical protein STEG23_018413, partial [Scotinomys teguina]